MVKVTRQSLRRSATCWSIPKLVLFIFGVYLSIAYLFVDESKPVPLLSTLASPLDKKSAATTAPVPRQSAATTAPEPRQLVLQPPLEMGVQGQPCRHDGHCGVGMTCAVDKSSTMTRSSNGIGTGGSCQPFILSEELPPVELSPCAQRCKEGLSENAILLSVSSSMITTNNIVRPDACVLTFRREEEGYVRDGYNWDAFHASLLHHRIVRLDPILNSTTGKPTHAPPPFEKQQLWMAVCFEPCSALSSSCPEGYLCSKDEVCRRDEAYWKTLDSDMVIVSGADRMYFNALQNLAGSLRFWAPNQKLVVYNLGMSEEQMKRIESWRNVLAIKWRTGLPDRYPGHLNVGKAYAWKPVAMNESLHEYKQIFWLDAGSTVAGPVTEAIRVTQENGIFLMRGQDEDMKGRSYPKTYTAFGYDKDTFRGGPHYSGNTQAYLYPSRYVNTVVIPNAQCALDHECIMPEGSSLANHRYDQTSLSILAYRDDLRIPHFTIYLAADRGQLADDLRTPSSKFIWTSRGSCVTFMNEE